MYAGVVCSLELRDTNGYHCRLTSTFRGRGADMIVVSEVGHIVERGSFASLPATDGRFAALWRSQTGDHSAKTEVTA